MGNISVSTVGLGDTIKNVSDEFSNSIKEVNNRCKNIEDAVSAIDDKTHMMIDNELTMVKMHEKTVNKLNVLSGRYEAFSKAVNICILILVFASIITSISIWSKYNKVNQRIEVLEERLSTYEDMYDE